MLAAASIGVLRCTKYHCDGGEGVVAVRKSQLTKVRVRCEGANTTKIDDPSGKNDNNKEGVGCIAGDGGDWGGRL